MEPDEYFTDFEGRLNARLSRVIPAMSPQHVEGRFSGISARYDCRIKIEYHQEIMKLLEEGMLVAVKNFKSAPGSERYTLLEISKVLPEHFGLRGLSDQSYYPMQFEIIEQAVPDWSSNDRSTMMVQASAIPINYDLTVGAGGPEFAKGFSFPVPGEEALILSSGMIDKMYNETVLDKLAWPGEGAGETASPSLGTIKMFLSEGEEPIPIYLDFESLLRYHFGIFAFTGGGKSNLLANLLRRTLLHLEDSRIVVFDISSEYPFLLADIISDEKIPSVLIMEGPVSDADQLFDTVVKPKEFEEEEGARPLFQKMLDLGRVGYFSEPPSYEMPTYGGMLRELSSIGGNVESPQGQAAQEIKLRITARMREIGASDSDVPDDASATSIGQEAETVLEERSLRRGSTLHNWAAAMRRLPELVRLGAEHAFTPDACEFTLERICDTLQGDTRLICLSISDPDAVKRLAVSVTSEMLRRRKSQFKVRPYILFVFDEAQEFIPHQTTPGLEGACSKSIERLLRQGRKYGLGCCISTQRIAYLNTNALQQLHTYFVGTLPRPYDRTVVSDVFAVDLGILEKTLEFAPGDWMVSSYAATGMRNVPIFIHADDTEEILRTSMGLEPGSG
jgi:hypothetical protein